MPHVYFNISRKVGLDRRRGTRPIALEMLTARYLAPSAVASNLRPRPIIESTSKLCRTNRWRRSRSGIFPVSTPFGRTTAVRGFYDIEMSRNNTYTQYGMSGGHFGNGSIWMPSSSVVLCFLLTKKSPSAKMPATKHNTDMFTVVTKSNHVICMLLVESVKRSATENHRCPNHH